MKRKGETEKPPAPVGSNSDCVVPPALPKGELHKLLFRHSEHEAQEIRNYVEWQAHGEEKVLHAEKVASERVFGRDYDVWDVHTDKERWWVVTSPTNLYSQTLMLATHQFQADAQSGGIGRPNWSSLTMRRMPRVNQDNLLRFRFAG